MTPFAIAIAVLMLSAPLSAQWVDLPTPGIPRTANGKPNLTAPAPRTADGKPDLTGLWQRISPKYYENIAADLKPGEIQPWAEALVQTRKENLHKDHMSLQCLPWGPSYSSSGRMAKFIQTPGVILMLDDTLTYRQIFMDGRKLETDPSPSWMGYSVGHWDGGTLVVESNGYNDRSWLDRDGHAHTEALRMTERYRRRDFGHMDIEVTRDEVDSPPKKAGKSRGRLRHQLRFSPSLKLGGQPPVGDRDFDNSGMRSHSPQVLLPVGAGVFRQDLGGDFYFGLLIVGGLAHPVLVAGGALVADRFEQFRIRDQLRVECDRPRPGVHLGVGQRTARGCRRICWRCTCQATTGSSASGERAAAVQEVAP